MVKELQSVQKWPVKAMKIVREKILGAGEDAAELLKINILDLLIVCDGMGGAGARRYVDIDGIEKSGARIASELAVQVAVSQFHLFASQIANDSNAFTQTRLLEFPQELKVALQTKLTERARSLEDSNPVPRIRSRMQKDLPTTITGFVVARRGDWIDAVAFWAGDSRVYVLERKGLRQVSIDDLSGKQDPYDNLRHDSPLANMVYAGTDFHIWQKLLRFEQNCFLIAASDGAFGYLPTPMHFERLLIKAICDSTNSDAFQELIQSRLSQVAGDDVSLIIRPYGFSTSSFSDLHKVFEPRLSELNQFLLKYDELAATVGQGNDTIDRSDKLEQLGQNLWKQYKVYHMELSGLEAQS